MVHKGVAEAPRDEKGMPCKSAAVPAAVSSKLLKPDSRCRKICRHCPARDGKALRREQARRPALHLLCEGESFIYGQRLRRTERLGSVFSRHRTHSPPHGKNEDSISEKFETDFLFYALDDERYSVLSLLPVTGDGSLYGFTTDRYWL